MPSNNESSKSKSEKRKVDQLNIKYLRCAMYILFFVGSFFRRVTALVMYTNRQKQGIIILIVRGFRLLNYHAPSVRAVRQYSAAAAHPCGVLCCHPAAHQQRYCYGAGKHTLPNSEPMTNGAGIEAVAGLLCAGCRAEARPLQADSPLPLPGQRSNASSPLIKSTLLLPCTNPNTHAAV